MSMIAQKRLLRVLIPIVIVGPLIWAMSALWTHTIVSFQAIATGIVAVGAALLIISVPILMYLGERGGPVARPTQWKREPRRMFFMLVFLVSGFLFISLLVTTLLVWNIWKVSAEEMTAIATADVLILIGLLLITELFSILNMLRRHNGTTGYTSD